jgi:hypothetical protein
VSVDLVAGAPIQTAETVAATSAALLIEFWPMIHALIRRRWRRAAVYFVLAMSFLWIATKIRTGWELGSFHDLWEIDVPTMFYPGLTWWVMLALLWAITTTTDVVLSTRSKKIS